MIELTNSACIEASTDKVWVVLADLEGVHTWVEPIKSARCIDGKSRGLGAIRVCDLSGGISITEEWTAWDEGKSFEYIAVGMPLIERATNRWELHREKGDKTLLISHAEIILKGGVFGKLLEPVMRPVMKAMGPRTLASLKHLVEHGTPFQGKHSKLALAPVTC